LIRNPYFHPSPLSLAPRSESHRRFFLQPIRDWLIIVVAGQQPILPGTAKAATGGNIAHFALRISSALARRRVVIV